MGHGGRRHTGIEDRDQWPGENKFGQLLTKLRDQMMAHDIYAQESEATNKERAAVDLSKATVSKKRSLENQSPDVTSKRAS